MRTRTHLLLTVALMGAVVLAFVPVAEAQTSQFNAVISITPTSEKVKPLQGSITMSGQVSFTGDPQAFGNIVGIPVEYKVTKNPAWASVTVSPANDVIQAGQPGANGQVTGTKSFTVSVLATDQAPAFQAENIEITATFRPANPGAAAKSVATTVPIQADYFSILDVQLAQAIQQDRPQATVTFPVKITNLGNGNTKVSFAIAEGGNPQNLNAPIPIPVTLQSKQAGGNAISAEIPLQIQLPYKNGYMNDVGVVTYKITSNYALDSKLRGDETTLSVLVTTKGFYVPGPTPLVVVGLLMVGAFLFRRRG